jgi:hypothetical protein
MGLADQLTLARVAAVPLVVPLYISDFLVALLVSLVLTWLSGLDYARLAPGLLRGRTVAP